MSDRSAELPPIKDNGVGRIPIEVSGKVMPNPDHLEYTADKAVFRVLAEGRSGLIAAIDGVGSGGEKSAKAAEFVADGLWHLETESTEPLTIDQAVNLLRGSISRATAKIKELQDMSGDPDVDTTVSAGIICESPDGERRFLVTANVGDSRIYRYTPSSGVVDQLTVDHSIVQRLVAMGMITPEEAFLHPQRNVVLRTVGSLESPDDIDIQVVEIHEGDIFLAVSDGVSDNLPPEGLPVAIQSEFKEAYDPVQNGPDLSKFATGLAQRARNIQMTHSAHAKPDDTCVSVLRVPRTK
ncbi:MAG: protein phosphatase 2C domain-containing protein [Candidatus Shapirobacteria bacterium]